MLWLIDRKRNVSFSISQCNLFTKGDEHQLWVAKANGKTEMIRASYNIDDVQELKDAIDKAIEIGETTFQI